MLLSLALVAGTGCDGCHHKRGPFDPTPSVAKLPRGELLLEEMGVLGFSDGTGELTEWRPPNGEDPLHHWSLASAWWSSTRHAHVIARDNDYRETPRLRQFLLATPDGAVRELARRERALPPSGLHHDGCTMLVDGSRVACYAVDTPYDGVVTAVRVTVDALDGTPPSGGPWAEGVTAGREPVVSVAPDGKTYFAASCPSQVPSRRCLYRAGLDGSARTQLAVLEGNACAIAAAPDGSRLAIAVEQGDACSVLEIVDRTGAITTHIERPGTSRAHGIGAIAFSPDGTRLAYASDHMRGCTSSQGMEFCENDVFVIRSDGREERRFERGYIGVPQLAWVPAVR